MKMYIKITILLVILICVSNSKAQYLEYAYSYDNAGNRVKMKAIVFEDNDNPIIAKNCVDSTQFIVDTILEGYKMLLYPNPSKRCVNFEISNHERQIGEFSLFDISGKILTKGICDSHFMTLDLSAFANGIYLFEFYIDNKRYYYKIIKK